METGGKNPKVCECIQVAACVINPRSLELYRDRKGNPVYYESLMQPLDFDALEDRALEINGKTKEQLREAPLPSVVWPQFASFCKQYNMGGKSDGWSCPIAAGYNINNFDMVIVQRLCEQYKILDKEGKQGIFNNVYTHDVLQLVSYWFNGQKEPTKYNMDAMRDYFGIDKTGAHDALKDVYDTAAILQRFMNLARNLQHPDKKPKIKFRDSFRELAEAK
jgi:DNA polymerase III epsilon subunit-like protein